MKVVKSPDGPVTYELPKILKCRDCSMLFVWETGCLHKPIMKGEGYAAYDDYEYLCVKCASKIPKDQIE